MPRTFCQWGPEVEPVWFNLFFIKCRNFISNTSLDLFGTLELPEWVQEANAVGGGGQEVCPACAPPPQVAGSNGTDSHRYREREREREDIRVHYICR
ncbi:hypothetical protein FHG87_014541 [Trinorchestia longiramus]|nr:hypothetical protein FHG87_014541 [Trinorchestia longiramus]